MRGAFFLKDEVLTAQIYLITSSFGGLRTYSKAEAIYAELVLVIRNLMKKCNASVYLKIRESAQPISK
jgi:hypothetical protein